MKLNSKRSLNLSEQCVVDCMPNSYGCVGGSPYAALEFAKMFGLSNGSPNFYEYKGSKSTCNMKKFPAIINSGGCCIKYLNGDENELKKMVAKQPVVVGVSMTMNMLYYKKGIFSDRSCDAKLNHVLVREVFELFLRVDIDFFRLLLDMELTWMDKIIGLLETGEKL